MSEKAYIEFISGLKDTVFRLARSIVCSEAEAEDVVQDLFERVWRARDAVLTSEYPRAYVCRMAHNLAIDRQRQQARERSFAKERPTNMASDGNRDTNIVDITTLTLQFIGELPEKQRIAIHMRDVEGYEIEEIAKILECDDASVRMNLSRARKTIRERLINSIDYGVKRS